MRTADKIASTYRAAKYLGREGAELLELEDDGQTIAILKQDATGYNTSEWTIWVDRSARRQVAWVYVPRTGYEAAITADDAATVILLDGDPERL